MAKKKTAKRVTKKKVVGSPLLVAAAPANVNQTICEQGGTELLPVVLTVSAGSQLAFDLRVCRTSSRVVVMLNETLLLDQTTDSGAHVPLGSLPAGSFNAVTWYTLNSGANWQNRSEIAVDGLVRFRRRKSSDSSHPSNMGFCIIEVLP